MNILLDTHILLWSIANSSRVPKELRNIIEDEENNIYFSIVSVWEVAIKNIISNEILPIDEKKFIDYCDDIGIRELYLKNEHISCLHQLLKKDNTPKHNDPFDRLLLAQSMSENLILYTHDKAMIYYNNDLVKLI